MRTDVFFDFSAGNRLLKTSLEDVTGNVWPAIRISLLPVLVLLLALAGLNYPIVVALLQGDGLQTQHTPALHHVLLSLGAVVFVVYAIAVGWHRFIILDPAARRKIPVLATLRYALKSIAALFGILLVCVIALMVFLPMLGGGRINVGGFVLGYMQSWPHLVLTALFTWVFFWFSIVLSPSLVESAVEGGEGVFGPLWRSRGRAGEARAAALIISACLAIWDVAGFGIASVLPETALVLFHLALTWLAFMLSVAVFTTFYRTADRAQSRSQRPDKKEYSSSPLSFGD